MMVRALLSIILAVLSTAIAQEDLACSQDFLFAASEDSKGVSLSLFYPGLDYSSAESHQELVITGKTLSTECGLDSFRCLDPLIVTTDISGDAKKHIVFVPLSDGLLLVELLQSIKLTTVAFGNWFLLGTMQNEQQSCSPVKAFEIAEAFYMACIDSSRSYVSLYLIYLNQTSLSDSRISSTPISYFYITEDISTLSNFISITESGMRLVLFTVENIPYGFDTLAFTGFVEFGTIGRNCTAVQKLEFIGDSRLLAYCPAVNVIYSTEFENWEFEWDNMQDGIKYFCPDPRVELRVFTTDPLYLKFSINDRAGNVNLPGNGFKEGICFGTLNLFAYSDLDGSVYVLNITGEELRHVKNTQCSSPGCLSIHVTDNRYLTIRENNIANNLMILDSEKNLSVILDIPRYTAPVFSLFANVPFDSCGQRNMTVIGFDVGVILGAVIGSSVFALTVVVSLIVFGLWYKEYRRRPLSHPIQEIDKVETENNNEINGNQDDKTEPNSRASNLPRTTIQIQNDSILTSAPPAPVVPSIQEVDSYCSTKRVGNTNSDQMLGNVLDQPPNRDTIATISSTIDPIPTQGASNVMYDISLRSLDNEGAPLSPDTCSESSFPGVIGDDIPLLKLREH